MYETKDDPYCYPGSSVLKNRLGLRRQHELETFEKFITTQRADEPLPVGRSSYAHYCAIHRHLFGDVYSWAGRIRTVRLSKQGSSFCYPEYIHCQMRRIFDEMADDNYFRDLDSQTFARKAAHFLAELNAIHPFREGNGRTQMVFLLLIADQAGHPLDPERLEPTPTIEAMIASFHSDEQPLANLILDLMRVR